MPRRETIADAEVRVGIDDSDLRRGLADDEARVRSTIRTLDGLQAHVDVKANISDLEREIKRARLQIKELEGEHATATIDADRKELSAAIKLAKAELKGLEGEHATATLELDDKDAQEKIVRLQAQFAKLERQRARMKTDVEAGPALLQMEAIRKQLERMGAEPIHVEVDTHLDSAGFRRSATEIDAEIEKLHAELDALGKMRPKPNTDLEISLFEAKRELLKKQIRDLSRERVHVDADVETKIARRDINDLGSTLKAGMGLLTGWGQKFGQLRVSAGPVSGSMAEVGAAGMALLPVITSLVGSIGALAGAAAAGAAGMGLIGGAAGGIAAVGFGSLFAVIKPALDGLKKVKTAQDAYTLAVDQYGPKSKQAATAQAHMNAVMKQQGPAATAAAKQLSTISDEWSRLSKPAQHTILDTVAQGAKALRADLPTLSGIAQSSATAMGRALDPVFKSLSGKGAQGVMKTFGAGFAESIGPLTRAASTFGSTLAHMAADAVPAFVQFSHTLDQMAVHFQTAMGSGAHMQSIVNNLVSDAKRWGSAFAAAGRVIMDVFRGGASSGMGMVDALTKLLDKWHEFLGSTQGQNAMHDFFKSSVANSEALFSVVGHLVAALFKVGPVLTPIATGFLDILNVVASVASKVSGLTTVLTAVGGALAVAFATGKVLAFADAIVRVSQGLKTLAETKSIASAMDAFQGGGLRRTAVGTAETVAGGVAPAAVGAARAAGTAEAAASVEAAAGGAAALGAGEAAAAAEGVTLMGVLGPLGIAAGIAGAAFLLLGGHSKSAADQLKAAETEAGDAMRSLNSNAQDQQGAFAGLASTHLDLASANRDVASAQAKVDKLYTDGKAHTAAYRQAEDDLNRALAAREPLQAQAQQYLQQENKDRKDAAKITNGDMLTAQKALTKAQSDYNDALQPHGREAPAAHAKAVADAAKVLADAQKNLNNVSAQAATQIARADLAAMNYQRALHGLQPVAAGAAQAIHNLQGIAGSQLTSKLALQVNDADALAKIARLSGAASSAGGKSIVLRILADDSTAKQKIAQLQALRLVEKKLAIGANPTAAMEALARVMGVKLPAKLQRVGENGSGAVVAALARILGIKLPNKQFTVSVNDNASAVARGIAATIAAIPTNKTITITTVANNAKAIRDSGHAEGGPVTGVDKAAMAAMIAPMATTGGRYSRPTFLVGEENRPEFVISTNPSYAAENRQYLLEAAHSLGVEMAAKGRSPGKKVVKHAIPLPLEDRIGPVDTSDLDALVQKQGTEVGRLKGRIHTIEGESGKTRAKHKDELTKDRGALPGAERKLHELQQDARTAKSYHDDFDVLETDIETDRQRMTLDDHNHDNKAFDRDKAHRAGLLKKRGGELQRAANYVNAHHLQGTKLGAAILLALGQSNVDIATAPDDAMTPIVDTNASSLDDLMSGTAYNGFVIPAGFNLNTMKNLQAALAVAGTNNTTDPNSYNDDKTAAQNLVNFYGGLLSTVQPLGNPDFTITAADDLTQAQSTLANLTTAGVTGTTSAPDQTAVLAQTQARLDASNSDRDAANAFISTAFGAGDIGSGSSSAWGAVGGIMTSDRTYAGASDMVAAAPASTRGMHNVFNINTLHPADPSMLKDIASAAVSGMGYQGSVPVTRTTLGL